MQEYISKDTVYDALAPIDADLARIIAAQVECPIMDIEARGAFQLIEEIHELRIAQTLMTGGDHE